jgi:LEA14-like dessication related protein
MKSLKNLVCALGILFFLNSCQGIKDLEFKEYKNFKLEKAGFSKSTITVDLVYYNPNTFGLELKNTDLDIFINDNLLGHSVQDVQVHIPKKQQFTLPLKIDVDMKNILKNSLTTLLSKEVTIKATGKIKVGKANIYKTLPFEYSTKQEIGLF